MSRRVTPPTCPYCGKAADLVEGRQIYGDTGADYCHKHFWRCRPCGAHVGTHQSKHQRHVPLGTLANAETRAARREAHAAFDPIWKRLIRDRGWSKTKARRRSYRWLASELGVEGEAHIAEMDAATAARVPVAVADAGGSRAVAAGIYDEES